MPTYEYECQKCEHAFEAFQQMSADPLKKCPECKGKLKRLIGTGAGLLFKGSGFYETDYRSESYKSGEKSAKDASDVKKDTKPAEKAKEAKKPAAASKGKSKPAKKASSSKKK